MSYEQNGRKYVTHYKIIEWHSREDWETLLNQMDAEGGWRVDAHKLEKDFNGCTIFTKSETLKVPLLDASIACREIYAIVNSTAMYDLQQKEGNQAEAACRMICEKIASVCGAGD